MSRQNAQPLSWEARILISSHSGLLQVAPANVALETERGLAGARVDLIDRQWLTHVLLLS